MNRRILFCLALVVLLLGACICPGTRGSGKITTQSRDVSGFDQVSLGGSSSDYDVQVVDGKVIITSTDDFAISTLENADYVSFDDGSAIINANGRDTGSAGRMLESDFGEGTYDAYAAAIGNTDENDDVELVLLAQEIINSSSLDGLDGADFVNALYQGVFGRDADAGGLDFYVNALADNSKTQAQILADFGWSDEGVDTYDNVNEIDGLV
jgi:hypothetical protein